MVKFPMVKYPMVKFPMVKYPLVKSAAPGEHRGPDQGREEATPVQTRGGGREGRADQELVATLDQGRDSLLLQEP